MDYVAAPGMSSAVVARKEEVRVDHGQSKKLDTFIASITSQVI